MRDGRDFSEEHYLAQKQSIHWNKKIRGVSRSDQHLIAQAASIISLGSSTIMSWLIVGKATLCLIMEPWSIITEDVSLNLDLTGINGYAVQRKSLGILHLGGINDVDIS